MVVNEAFIENSQSNPQAGRILRRTLAGNRNFVFSGLPILERPDRR